MPHSLGDGLKAADRLGIADEAMCGTVLEAVSGLAGTEQEKVLIMALAKVIARDPKPDSIQAAASMLHTSVRLALLTGNP